VHEHWDHLRGHAHKGGITQVNARPQAKTPHPDWQTQAIDAMLYKVRIWPISDGGRNTGRNGLNPIN
jgi:hypothetical protein